MTPPTPPAVSLSEIGQIMVPVRELERAVRFYRDSLGMRFLFEAPGMAFFWCGGVRVMLGVPERPELAPPGSIIYYKVADIHAAAASLAARGVAIENGPQLVARLPGHDLWLADFRDPDGNVLELMSEVPR